jgi:hypothetical protein
MLAARYEFERVTIYSGWEYILFRNPSDSYPNGFTAIGGYPVPAGYVNSTAYTENKILRIFWAGVKYALRDDLDIAGSYYRYDQNDYNTSPCTNGGLSASSCRGSLDALGAMVDYRPTKRVDAYAGVIWRVDTCITPISRRRSAFGCGSERRFQDRHRLLQLSPAQAARKLPILSRKPMFGGRKFNLRAFPGRLVGPLSCSFPPFAQRPLSALSRHPRPHR